MGPRGVSDPDDSAVPPNQAIGDFARSKRSIFRWKPGRLANLKCEPIEVSACNNVRIYLIAHAGSQRSAPIRTLGNHKIARRSGKPPEAEFGGTFRPAGFRSIRS